MLSIKMTFFGEYGTGQGHSEDLPPLYIKEIKTLTDLANRISFYEQLSETEGLTTKNRTSMFNYINAFLTIYEKVYGHEASAEKNVFDIARKFMQGQRSEIITSREVS